MTPLDIDFDQLLVSDDEGKAEAEIFKINPEFMTSILSVATKVLQDTPGESEEETLYITVKHFLSATKFTHCNDSALSGFFSTYIESYRGLKLHQNLLTKDNEGFVPVNLELLYNDAALSLFDLYLQRPRDPLVRRLLITAVSSIHEITTMVQSETTDRPLKDVIGDITNIAVISQTLKNYIRGVRRSTNFEYIRWLKTFLAKVLSTKDISFMQSDETLKDVIKQITERKKIIIFPH